MSKPELARTEVVVERDQEEREQLRKAVAKINDEQKAFEQKYLDKPAAAPALKLGDTVTYWVERYGKLHAQPAMVVGGPWTQTCANLRVFLDGTNVADEVTPPFTQKEMAWGSAWRTSVTLATEPKAGFFTR